MLKCQSSFQFALILKTLPLAWTTNIDCGARSVGVCYDGAQLTNQFKLWDICDRSRCPFFVVSTYVGWVFGAFSRGGQFSFNARMYND